MEEGAVGQRGERGKEGERKGGVEGRRMQKREGWRKREGRREGGREVGVGGKTKKGERGRG